jgi:large subunit ribosomal protein L16
MLMPKRAKYRKQMRGRMKGLARGATTVQFGEYGLQALEPAWITSRQIGLPPDNRSPWKTAW